MGCKHRRVEGNTTKYFVCGITEKPINDIECNNCMMKIEDDKQDQINELFSQMFGGGFGK